MWRQVGECVLLADCSMASGAWSSSCEGVIAETWVGADNGTFEVTRRSELMATTGGMSYKLQRTRICQILPQASNPRPLLGLYSWQQNFVAIDEVVSAVTLSSRRLGLGLHMKRPIGTNPITQKRRHPQNRKYITYRNALEDDRATTMCESMFTKNLVKFSRVIYEICEQTDRQTDRQTSVLIAIRYTAPPCCSARLITGGQLVLIPRYTHHQSCR